MSKLYDTLLDAWGEKKKSIRKYRALYVSRNDADYLRYAHEDEEELKHIENALEAYEIGL